MAVPPKGLTWKGSSSESGIEREATEEIDLTHDDGQSSVSVGAEAATTTAGLRSRCKEVEEREFAVKQREKRLNQKEMALKERERRLESARKDLTCLMEAHDRGVRSWREERKRREETEKRGGESSASRARKERVERRSYEEKNSSRRSPTRVSGANHASRPGDRATTPETTTSERGRQVSSHYCCIDLMRQRLSMKTKGGGH